MMTVAQPRYVRISPRISIPLSMLMICSSVLTLTGVPTGDGPEWPLFTSIRDPKTMLNIINHRRMHTPAWLFQGAKGLASIAWCVAIPLQHNQGIRRNRPALHRTIGYVVIVLSIDLGLAGLWMLVNGMVTSHENLFHIHSLGIVPFIMWPTFSATTAVLSIPYFFSLARLLIAVRSQNIETHRRWAVFHSMCGYFIAIARFVVFLITFTGRLLLLFPEDFKSRWLHVPSSVDAIIDAEVSALALSLASAGCITAFWTWYEWSQAGIPRAGQKLSTDSAKKTM